MTTKSPKELADEIAAQFPGDKYVLIPNPLCKQVIAALHRCAELEALAGDSSWLSDADREEVERYRAYDEREAKSGMVRGCVAWFRIKLRLALARLAELEAENAWLKRALHSEQELEVCQWCGCKIGDSQKESARRKRAELDILP